MNLNHRRPQRGIPARRSSLDLPSNYVRQPSRWERAWPGWPWVALALLEVGLMWASCS